MEVPQGLPRLAVPADWTRVSSGASPHRGQVCKCTWTCCATMRASSMPPSICERRPLTGASLARVLWRYPLMTAQVVGAIHWQALRLWLKRNPVHDHPQSIGRHTVNAIVGDVTSPTCGVLDRVLRRRLLATLSGLRHGGLQVSDAIGAVRTRRARQFQLHSHTHRGARPGFLPRGRHLRQRGRGRGVHGRPLAMRCDRDGLERCAGGARAPAGAQPRPARWPRVRTRAARWGIAARLAPLAAQYALRQPPQHRGSLRSRQRFLPPVPQQ